MASDPCSIGVFADNNSCSRVTHYPDAISTPNGSHLGIDVEFIASFCENLTIFLGHRVASPAILGGLESLSLAEVLSLEDYEKVQCSPLAENLSSQRLELRAGVLVLVMPQQRHEFLSREAFAFFVNVFGCQVPGRPRYFMFHGATDISQSQNRGRDSRKGPDESFAPRGRSIPRGSNIGSATFVIEIANSDSLQQLKKDKELHVGDGYSSATIFLGIKIPFTAGEKAKNQCTIIFKEQELFIDGKRLDSREMSYTFPLSAPADGVFTCPFIDDVKCDDIEYLNLRFPCRPEITMSREHLFDRVVPSCLPPPDDEFAYKFSVIDSAYLVKQVMDCVGKVDLED